MAHTPDTLTPSFFHTIIVGAGAAGMMCAARIGQVGRRVALINHAVKIGEKIRISGGGRCNFTNRHLDGRDGSHYYVSEQPRFVRHALARYTAADFCALLDRHGVSYYEKHQGQLFCDHSARDVITVLQQECARPDKLVNRYHPGGRRYTTGSHPGQNSFRVAHIRRKLPLPPPYHRHRRPRRPCRRRLALGL